MSRYTPPSQVNARFSVTLYNVEFEVKLSGYLCEDGPEIEESIVWINYPDMDERCHLNLAPGVIFDEVCDNVPSDEIVKAFNSEYESHLDGYGDYLYEQEKDRRMNAELDKEKDDAIA